MSTEYKTCVVKQANKGRPVVYWLHISNVQSAPTVGHVVSRATLKQLRSQIDAVLSGATKVSGFLWQSSKDGLKLKVRNKQKVMYVRDVQISSPASSNSINATSGDDARKG